MKGSELRCSIREALDRAIGRLVLGAIGEATESNGRPPTRTEVARVLVGPKRMQGEARLDQPVGAVARAAPPGRGSLRGMLGRFGVGDVHEAIGLLEWCSLVERTDDRRSRLRLTPAGEQYVLGRSDRPTGVAEKLLRRDDATDPAFQALRELRKRLAAEDGMSAGYVLGNRTLRALAARRPRTHEELMAIPGIAAAKAIRYGRAILEVLANAPPRVSEVDAAREAYLEEQSGGSTTSWDASLEPADFGIDPTKVAAVGAGVAPRIAEVRTAYRTRPRWRSGRIDRAP